MNLINKLIAGSALVFMAGCYNRCYNTIFEGKIGKDKVKLECLTILTDEEQEILTITQANESGMVNCSYKIGASKGKVYFAKKTCPGITVTTHNSKYFGLDKAQVAYDAYISSIKEEIEK